MILNGEEMPNLLMTIIRFILPLQDHFIKKLLLIFWEIESKGANEVSPKNEMILVCDAFRKDLHHPNEFIRGSTLRLLCKLKDPELLEPLLPSIKACLEHRNAYVRKNAILAIFTIYKNFGHLLPDAPEIISNFLQAEKDMACRRNAFLILLEVDQNLALGYLSSNIGKIDQFEDTLQLVIIQLIYKVCHKNPEEKSKFIPYIYHLLINSKSPSVRHEAAGTMALLSNTPSALKAAASCYIDLIIKAVDINVKLIVLDQLANHFKGASSGDKKVFEDLAMDILRILSTPDLEVRENALNLALDLLTPKNAVEMASFLRNEIERTHNAGHVDTIKYRQLLVRNLGKYFIKIPDLASTVIPILIKGIPDNNEVTVSDVLIVIREAAYRFPVLRPKIIEKLLEIFPTIKSSQIQILKSIIWIICEYSMTLDDMRKMLNEIGVISGNPLRFLEHLIDDFFIGASIGASLTKMIRRLYSSERTRSPELNLMCAEVMHILTSILLYGNSGCNMTADDADQISLCIRLLVEPNEKLSRILTSDSHQILAEQAEFVETTHNTVIQPDEHINFIPQANLTPGEDIFVQSLNQAIGIDAKKAQIDVKLVQLTGFSDPIYAEAYIKLNQSDIELDILLVNQTSDTLINVNLELVPLGGLKLASKHPSLNLGPHDFTSISAFIKVTSTENNVILGNIVYDVIGSSDQNVVILNDIHIDILEYIIPATCTHAEFRDMWAKFEWENKVVVNTSITDMHLYLAHLIKSTNMRCLPKKALNENCGFMVANLYAKSIFGEDALANLSIEKPNNNPNASIMGHIRIRAKTRGLALSLGDKIKNSQNNRLY